MAKATYQNGNEAGLLSQDGGRIGMISKMGGRMMYYYADDLTEMLIDDILRDTVIDLQVIEQKERQNVAATEGKQMAENIMMHLVDYQSE